MSPTDLVPCRRHAILRDPLRYGPSLFTAKKIFLLRNGWRRSHLRHNSACDNFDQRSASKLSDLPR